jgi:shikimate 5-dehydrogenase
MSDTKVIKNSRRTFLLAVGAGGAATAAAIAAKVAPPRLGAVVEGTPDARSGKGYEETAHIRNYYRTTKV